MKKILVIQPLHPKAIDALSRRNDIEYQVITDFSESNLLRLVASVDAITVRDAPLSENVISAATSLKAISRHGVGYDNIPVALCSARRIPVLTVGPVNAVSVAEHTIYLLLSAARLGAALDYAVREGRFSARSLLPGVELNGKTLFLVGLGRIGREVGRRAGALGMRVTAFDPYTEENSDVAVRRVSSLEEGLREADAVSLHVPLTSQTRGILGARELSLLPKGAIVVNASRGGLIDENALVKAIGAGALHGAGLDTFETEPLPESSPLIGEKRIVLSPHSAALTEDALIAMGLKTVENVLAALDGHPDPNNIVNAADLLEVTNAAE
jgi:D-3-phosphoglycerate dehydrogenase